jgi:predicted anti-sigma-YlaC factor YlaD
VNCSVAREAISATLDGEAPGVASSELSRHLAACADCNAWRESAHIVTRRARLAPAEAAPTVREGLLAAVREESRESSRTLSPLTEARLGLVAIAIIQIVLTVPALILGSDREAPLHVAHEMGAFDMALAIGFLAAAWQPERARGMHVLVGAAALLLLGTAVVDLLTGHTTAADEAPHLLVLAGWRFMYWVAAEAPIDEGESRSPLFPLPHRRTAVALDVPVWRGAPDRDVSAATEPPAIERRTASA